MARAGVLGAVLLAASVSGKKCPDYASIANLTGPVKNFDFAKFAGTWYEVYSHNIPVLSTGCHCSHYHYEYAGHPQTNATEEFICNKFSYSGKVTDLHMTMDGIGTNKTYPGASMHDRFFGMVSGPYWVLDVVEDAEDPKAAYQYALPYACVDGLEVVYLFSRSPSIPSSLRDGWMSMLSAKGVSTADIKEVPQGSQCEYP
eukprot:TRINITY_DN32475_c0_g1_i1.p1 TRINITY_DN32475_c0_g1~~TRINITY_DN32475_c0_g1_i1.p1  ORF type:complete len:225 (+),score=52.82 TRINITY_DN32475_c0_g1_i1:75-677(+)